MHAAAKSAKSLQSCPTLCEPIDGSPPGSPIPGILQARTLEWVSTSLSNTWKWKVKVKSLSRIWLFATPWTAAYQALPSMGFSRQAYWSGVSYMRRRHNTQAKKPCEDGGRDWVDASKKPGNAKDCWQLPEAVGEKACDRSEKTKGRTSVYLRWGCFRVGSFRDWFEAQGSGDWS